MIAVLALVGILVGGGQAPCLSPEPGPILGFTWVCVDGGWRIVPSPGEPIPRPEPPQPHPPTVNRITALPVWFEGSEPNEWRPITFRLVPGAGHNCDGTVLATWKNDTAFDLAIKDVRIWHGANHDAPPVDISTHVLVTYPGNDAVEMTVAYHSWERYRTTDWNDPVNFPFGTGFMRLDRGSSLRLKMMCSKAVGVPTAWLAETTVYVETRHRPVVVTFR